jgi:hypothetical protein
MVIDMIAGRQFIYQTSAGTVYLVSDEVKEINARWSPDSHIVAYIDADLAFEFKPFMNHEKIQLVIACPPNGALNRFRKQLVGTGGIRNLMLKLWTPQEFYLTGLVLANTTFRTTLMKLFRLFLQPDALTFADMKRAASYLGLNPRRAFFASISESLLAQHKAEIIDKIRDVRDVKTLLSLIEAATTSVGVSHSIFQIFPSNDLRLLSEAHIETVSAWALNRLLEQYEKKEADASFTLYQSLRYESRAGSLRGKMFERQVLKYLDKLKKPTPFKIRSLANGTITTWNYPGRAPRNTFEPHSFTPSLTEAFRNGCSTHFVPLDSTFPSVDSVLFDPKEGLTGIQVTIQDTHPVAVKGLGRLLGWLNQSGPLATLRPTQASRWRLIFILPIDVAAGFQEQTFVGDTKTGAWKKKIDQYVLGLDENTL